MPVPSYQVILDNEIDPESPGTSSLFFRLRDNVLAILGIDPAEANPVMQMPPSQLVMDDFVRSSFSMSTGGGGTRTNESAEFKISRIAAGVERVEVLSENFTLTTTSPSTENTTIQIVNIEPVYSEGVCTGVKVQGRVSAIGASHNIDGGLINTSSFTSGVITLTNTYQDITRISDDAGSDDLHLAGKARADADFVYIQFRFELEEGHHEATGSLNLNRFIFRNKEEA